MDCQAKLDKVNGGAEIQMKTYYHLLEFCTKIYIYVFGAIYMRSARYFYCTWIKRDACYSTYLCDIK